MADPAALQARIGRFAEAVVADAATSMQDAARSRGTATVAGIPWDTGDLARQVTVRADALRITATSESVQGEVLERGRRAVTIRPRRRKALRFTVNGRTAFATVVHQPARPPRPWFGRWFTRAASDALRAAAFVNRGVR